MVCPVVDRGFQGMSDLCLYGFQDNVWDEFHEIEIDDHIVPQPADDTGDKYTIQSGSHTKLSVEVDDTTSSAKHFIVLRKREASSEILTKSDKMLNWGQWNLEPDGTFASCEGDTGKEDTCMVSSNSTITYNCFKSGTNSESCARDSIMEDPTMSVDNNLYDYHLSQISQSETSLNFFDNGDNESSDLYYGWPDIGNFEDTEKMLSCDSTFGLGNLSNDDDLGWFSPSTAIEGSDDALRSSFKITCSESTVLRSNLENQRDYKLRRDDNFSNESRKKCIGEATLADNVQHVNGSEMKSESKEDSLHKEEMNLQIQQTELPNQMTGKKKDEYLENGACLQRSGHSKPILDAKAPYTDLSSQISNLSADYYHQVSQISECPPIPRPKESSHASNQVSKAGSLGHLDATSPVAISDPVVVLQRMHQNAHDSDDHSKVGVCVTVATGLDNSLTQETSSMSSMVDEISLEATSFRQLQQVMEKLDIRAKLCIRDSLYRLARSAEQRHNCLTPNITNKTEGSQVGDTILDDSNKCNTFMDIETDTNPIDRSVAHLLFHRPKDQSAIPPRAMPIPR